MKQKLVVIVGPTAVGKTKLSVSLAKKFDGEIISADSVQVYRGLNIGSAKVTKEEMQGVKHYLLDIKEPTEEYNASNFSIDAKKAIAEIAKKQKLPIVVGGTGLFVNSLLFGFSVDAKKDEEYRKELNEIALKEGPQKLYEMLEKVDKESASEIHPNHLTRIIRALEIYHVSGKKKSDFESKQESEFDYLLLAIVDDRNTLYERINKRVDQMFDDGLVDEVKNLLVHGVKKTDQSMHAIGYKETIEYLENHISLEECKEKIKQDSRNYAKRQLTYFKKMKGVIMLENNEDEIVKLVEEFYDRK